MGIFDLFRGRKRAEADGNYAETVSVRENREDHE